MPDPRPRRRWQRVAGAALLVVVLLAVVAVFALDRILLSQARRQAEALSRDLGRPVELGDVETKLWGGLGVRVTEVRVGPGEGEDRPLLELGRAEISVAALRALLTLGKEIHVRSAVLDGLHLNVLKLADGTTNLERAARALEKKETKEKAPAPERPAAPAPADESALRSLRVDRAAIENARVSFLDRTVQGAKELAIDDLDVEVKDLETGKPVEVALRAAVLAERQNLSLRVKAAPLPPSLEIVPEEIALQVEPIVLDPLAPFAPAEAGFRGGRLQANLEVKLGAAVPRGAGPTIVKGVLRATHLVFAGQEGGKALDVALDADLDADAAKGDLRIGKLDLAVGPAALVGKGRATGLRGDSPRFEGLEIVGRNLDPEALAAYYPPLRKKLGGAVIAGPIGLSVRGGGTAEAQTAEVRVDLTPVRLLVPAQLTKAAGAPLVVLLHARTSQGGERVAFDATADLAGVDLRPGGAVAKKPGDPMSLAASGSTRQQGDGRELRLDRVEVALLADRLRGDATVRLAGAGKKATTKFEAALDGDRLDLDRLLLPAPEPAKGAPGKAEPAAAPLDPAAFAGLSGTAALRLRTLRMKKMDIRDVVVRVRVEGDEVRFEEARLAAFGGTVSGAGTHLALARPDAPFEVALDLKGVEGKDALRMVGDHDVLAGKLDAALKLGGKGWKLGLLEESVTGGLDGILRDGAFLGKDLVASIAGPLAAKLPFAASRMPERGSTPLGKTLPFAFQIANGVATLKKPITAQTDEGGLSVEGGVRLDGTLELPATFALSPALVSRLTGGRAKPSEPVPVTFRIAGPAWKPRVEALSLDAAAKAIAQQAAAGALGRAVGVEGTSVQDVAAKKRAEAEARARQEADAQRKRLEDEAKKKVRGLFGR